MTSLLFGKYASSFFDLARDGLHMLTMENRMWEIAVPGHNSYIQLFLWTTC
jgi:hypothetical protein